MKIGSVVNSAPHKQITNWVNAAEHKSYEDIRTLLKDERDSDPEWFINGRPRRMTQLVNEIFTIMLMEVSEGRWSERDFEGRQHSNLISKAISSLTTRVMAEYRRLVQSMEPQQ